MNGNSTSLSTCTSINSRFGNSTIDVREPLTKEIGLALGVLNLIQSRIIFNVAKLKEGNRQRPDNVTHNFIDNTAVQCKEILDSLWTAIENLQVKSCGLRAVIFSAHADELLTRRGSAQLSIVDCEDSTENILTIAAQVGVEAEKQTKMYQDKKTHDNLLDSQDSIVELMAHVGQKIDLSENIKIPNKQEERNKVRTMRIKVAVATINCLLSREDIDFEQHPHLLDLKKKYRSVLSSKNLS